MESKAVSGIMLTLLLTSMLTLAFNIQPAKASGTIYIRANGSIDPPTANITSLDNVTYTFTGKINEPMVVERDNIVVAGAGYTLQGTGSGAGIDLTERSNVTIKNMEIKAFFFGISLHRSLNINVSGNTITNNTYGLYLSDSSNNHIFHNNFINNSQQVYVETSGYANFWDDGYPSGGNYWSDHNPLDLYSGPYQNETGRDGIGDTPYIIDGNNTDAYPLIYPHGYVPSPDLNGDGKVTIKDIGIVAIAFGSEPGDDDWDPIVDVYEDGKITIKDIGIVAIHFGEWWVCDGIYFDKFIYYPDIRAFWEPNLSVPIEITVVDREVKDNSVKVNVSSSIDSKEVTLTKDTLGVFSDTVFAVGIGLMDEPISNTSSLNVRYGDEIIAEYFDMSSGNNFTASALFVFPHSILESRYNNLDRWESSSKIVFDSDGIPMVNYGSTIGLQYNPVTISQYGLANYQAYLGTGSTTRREKFLAQAKWLAENAKQKGNYSVWEYNFNWPSYGCTDPWVSAMAQGQGLSVLTRAYVLTGNVSYIDVAEEVTLAFQVEMSAGGVRYTDSDGVWFEECADVDAPSSKVLNGFIHALLGLYECSFETNNSNGWTFFWEGVETLSNNIYRYDSGSWSYYDLLYYSHASLSYHKLHIEQLRILYELTDDGIFLYYSDKFQSYVP